MVDVRELSSVSCPLPFWLTLFITATLQQFLTALTACFSPLALLALRWPQLPPCFPPELVQAR